ncbi:synaptic vesicle glycoprotein 2A-like isoform X3 [Drosophila busckii]|uniref:synaptic vesicle glycoprotein 2A-like isoform X3 n=1 Tax=Drosophila busckii TaxID=30019 RepID=UPI00083F220C|nr:synaptic vesicle glycoprotein 2A-like isoform X3 [Drosophila busckii]
MRNLLARREAARTSTSEPVPEPPPPASADFETAIAACGFGCFNVLILFIAWPVLLAVLFSVMSMSFILPIAGRDLDIVLSMKGVLYALPFAGMILSAVPWAFISDTLGRRVVLISGGWLWLICVLCLALSQNSTQLMVFKFIDGLIICGPLASIYSYLSEFHAKQHRSMVILYVSICGSMAALILPIMAIFFLPLSIDFHIGSLSFKTWNVFLAISAVPSLIYGLMLIFLPETPKFLMSQGNYSAALKSLQFAYALNNRKSRKPFPITKLMDDSPESFQLEHSTLRQRFHLNMLKFVEGWRQLKPLCSRLYLPTAMKAFLINFLASVCISTMRAYLPSICHVMKILRNSDQADCSMCNVFEYIIRINATTEDDPAQCQGSYEEYLLVPVIGLVCSIIFLPIIRNNKIAIHLLSGILSWTMHIADDRLILF